MPTQRVFTTSKVARAAGVTSAVLRVWRQRGLLPGALNDADSEWKIYSWEQARRIVIMGLLVQGHIRVQKAFELASSAVLEGDAVEFSSGVITTVVPTRAAWRALWDSGVEV